MSQHQSPESKRQQVQASRHLANVESAMPDYPDVSELRNVLHQDVTQNNAPQVRRVVDKQGLHGSILQLQRTIGNEAVQLMLIERQTAVQDLLSSPLGKLLPESNAKRKTLKLGMRGKDVIILQRRLNVHGANLVEDGAFGSNTHKAVVKFQRAQAPPIDGIVGSITWGVLDKEPPSGAVDDLGGIAETDQKSLSEMTPGRFTPYVSAGFMDRNVGVLLNSFFTRAPEATFTADTAESALSELNSGLLAGILTQSNAGKAKAYLPKSEHDDLDRFQTDGLVINNVSRRALTRSFSTSGKTRALILLADDVMANAEQPGPGRDKAEQIIIHEFNHVRNFVAVENDIHDQVMFPTEFVDMQLAQQMTDDKDPGDNTTIRVRTSYIHEITARHAEFLSGQERLQARGEPVAPLKHGEFFNAAIAYARDEAENYGDNGYLKALREKDEALFRKQIAIWLRNLNVREFHGDSAINQQKQAFFELEFQLAQSANFTPFASKTRGMRLGD